MKRIPVNAILSLLLLASFCLASCAAPAQPVVLKIAVLPILDSLPLYVAQSEGYFKQHGVTVELVPIASAPERDQLMQAGQIDGMLNEVVSTIMYNRSEVKIVMLRFARTASAKDPLFRILAAKDSGITSVNDLRGVPIGISEATVIEYTTDRILEKAGLAAADVQKINVPKIPDRMALLEGGELKAANLPDPTASLAIQKGAVNVIDDTSYPEISHSVWSFKAQTVKGHPQEVRKFLAAVEDAVRAINADKHKWSGLLTERKLVPPPLLGSYVIPDYPLASVPSQAQFDDAQAWVKAKGLIEKDVNYVDMVDASFLPK